MKCTSIENLAAQTPTEYFIAYVHDAEINDNYYALFQKEDLEPIRGNKDLDVVLRHCFFLGISINNCTIYDKYSRVYSLR